MGSEVCRTVVADPDLELVAAIDPQHAGLDVREVAGIDDVSFPVSGEAQSLVHAGAEVAVDFTHVDAARQNLEFLAANGIHAVVGTSGFTEAECEALEASFTSSNCIIAPNFAIGAVLMMRFAELASPHFESAEIIEMHHHDKPDAPSGTALHTAARMAAARQHGAHDRGQEIVSGALGADVEGIPVHSLRTHGSQAHQEVVFGSVGQYLTLRHDTTDYECFAPGIVLALRSMKSLGPGVSVGLEQLLGV